jgi:hypothetical protein
MACPAGPFVRLESGISLNGHREEIGKFGRGEARSLTFVNRWNDRHAPDEHGRMGQVEVGCDDPHPLRSIFFLRRPAVCSSVGRGGALPALPRVRALAPTRLRAIASSLDHEKGAPSALGRGRKNYRLCLTRPYVAKNSPASVPLATVTGCASRPHHDGRQRISVADGRAVGADEALHLCDDQHRGDAEAVSDTDTLARIESGRVRAVPPAYLGGVGSTSQLSARPARGSLGACRGTSR